MSLSLPTPGSPSSPSTLARSLLSLLLSPDLRDSPALSSYLLVAAADGLATLALFIPFTFLPDLAVSKGVEPSNAAFLISAAGVTSSDHHLTCDVHPGTNCLRQTLERRISEMSTCNK